MPLKNLESNEELDQAISAGTLVWFSAPYCSPCKAMAPALKEIAEGREVLKVNIEQFPEIAEQHNVQSVPTLIDFRRNAIKAVVGLQPKGVLLKEFAV